MPRDARHVILDRDGVLDVERSDGGYIEDWSQWRWIPGALEGLAALSAARVVLSVATNQAGVGRGLIAPEALAEIHRRMLEEAARAGAAIQHVFVCPHAPDRGCACRKPLPGLLLDAIAAAGIPARATVLVGDDLRDVEAARAAGVAPVLVRTGKGRTAEAALAHSGVPVFDDLREFAAAFVAEPRFAFEAAP